MCIFIANAVYGCCIDFFIFTPDCEEHFTSWDNKGNKLKFVSFHSDECYSSPQPYDISTARPPQRKMLLEFYSSVSGEGFQTVHSAQGALCSVEVLLSRCRGDDGSGGKSRHLAVAGETGWIPPRVCVEVSLSINSALVSEVFWGQIYITSDGGRIGSRALPFKSTINFNLFSLIHLD